MKKELNKYLNSLTEKELIKEVKKLYDKFPDVKKYYEMELGDNSEKILAEYKAKIEKEYFPTRGHGRARNSVSKKVVQDFKKIAIHQKDVVELLLYRVEMMLKFTNAYGDIDEPFYNSLESSFHEACKMIAKERLTSYYKIYCEELVQSASNFGWGTHDSMSDDYHKYVSDDE